MSEMVFDCIRQRHSKRAFLKQDVPLEILARIFETAAHAPSSKNTQPWQVEVLLGPKVKEFSAMLCQHFDNNTPAAPDYTYLPDPVPEAMWDRARACGYGLFQVKGIERHDKVARRAHNRENFELFGAPAYCIFHLPANAEAGSFLDLGFFLQNVMLGLVASGLGSCPQFSVASYPQAIREFLGLAPCQIVCGLAIGYPDHNAEVNQYIPERLPLDAFVHWHQELK